MSHALIHLPERTRDGLTMWDAARQAIAQARSVDELKDIRDKAEAIRQYYKRRGEALEIQNGAGEIKLRAERRAGELLRDMEKAKGTAGQAKGRDSSGSVTIRPPEKKSPALSDLGVSKSQSSAWQKIASLDEETFEAHVAEKKESGELTSAGVVKLAKETQRATSKAAIVEQIKAEPLPQPKGPFRVIVVDPPWQYDKRPEDVTHRGANPYPQMSIEAICSEDKVPLRAFAAEDSVLWLWTTNAHMREAFLCLDAWGFTHKTILTWAKNKMGVGDWLRGKTEHCLMAVRGKPTVTLTNQTTLLEAPVREHSRKPGEFYTMVEALCPAPGYLDMFAREARGERWQVWGAETGKFQ